MTVQEVAEKLNITESAVYKMIRENRLIGRRFYYQPGKGYRVDEADVQRYIDGQS